MRPLPPFATATVLVAVALMVGGCASSPSAPSRPETPASSSAKPAPAPPAQDADSDDSYAKVASASTGTQSQAGSGSALPVGAAQTSDERRAAIERRLDDSLGTFDTELRKEQERLAKERDARQAAAVTTTTSTASDGTAAADPRGRSDNAGSAATEGPADQDARGSASGRRASADRRNARAGDLKSEKSAGTGAARNDNGGNGATARQIPDGSDDDVVARRLRKAAEQETDPELKDKLWKEYIDYKNNAGK